MARAANGASASSSDGSVNRLTGSARRLEVSCDTGSSQPIRVRVQNREPANGIHDDTEYAELAAGESKVFDASTENQIETLNIYTASGTGTYSFTVTG